MVTHRATGKRFALKTIELSKIKPKLIPLMKAEIAVLRRMDHPNVIRLYEVFEDKAAKQLSLILELCDGGDLHDRLKKQPQKHFSGVKD